MLRNRNRPADGIARAALTLGLLGALLTTACVEVQLIAEVRPDGSGVLSARYAVIKELTMGDFATLENNRILPLTEDEVRAFARQFEGVRVEGFGIEDIPPPPDVHTARPIELRRISYKLVFDDINALKTGHFRFAYYPYKNSRYFQFRIEKRVPGPDEDKDGRNMFAELALRNRNLTLDAYFPDPVLEGNGIVGAVPHKMTWTVPLAQIMSGKQAEIVLWARLPGRGDAFASRWNQLSSLWQPWMDPANLPPTILQDPELMQSTPQRK